MKSYEAQARRQVVRQPTETPKAYAAFCIYRDMRVARTQEKVCEVFYPPEGIQKASRNISQIRAWSSQWNWVNRCKDYDLDREGELREHTRKKDIEEHDRKLEQYRQDNEDLGRGLMAIGEKLLVTIDELISPPIMRLNQKQPLEKGDVDTILAAPAVIRAIALFAQTGSQLNADGLLIRQLIEHLKDNESS